MNETPSFHRYSLLSEARAIIAAGSTAQFELARDMSPNRSRWLLLVTDACGRRGVENGGAKLVHGSGGMIRLRAA